MFCWAFGVGWGGVGWCDCGLMAVVELAIQRYIGLHRTKPWQGSFIRWRDCWKGRIFRNGGSIYRSNGGEGEAVKSGSY